MKIRCAILGLAMAVALAAQAATITGKAPAAPGATVVYIDKIAGKTFPPAGKPFSLDQKGLTFQPHVLVIPAGSTVEFINSDSVAHNVFWPASGGIKGNNLGTWPQGQKRPFTFTVPGVVTLLCNVHPEMSAYIVVSPTPYFTTADASGNYKLDGVPDGTYTITVWHEGQKARSKPVTVKGDTKLDF